jgi:hypothetical protein
VRADVEIRQRRAADAAAPAMLEEATAGEKSRLPRQREALDRRLGEGVVELLDACEVNGNFP